MADPYVDSRVVEVMYMGRGSTPLLVLHSTYVHIPSSI